MDNHLRHQYQHKQSKSFCLFIVIIFMFNNNSIAQINNYEKLPGDILLELKSQEFIKRKRIRGVPKDIKKILYVFNGGKFRLKYKNITPFEYKPSKNHRYRNFIVSSKDYFILSYDYLTGRFSNFKLIIIKKGEGKGYFEIWVCSERMNSLSDLEKTISINVSEYKKVDYFIW